MNPHLAARSTPAIAVALACLAILPPSVASPPRAAWEPTSLGWQIADEGAAIHADTRGKSYCVAADAPLTEGGAIEVRVRLNGTTREGWRVAGVAWRADDDNFWHLVLARAPDNGGGRHYVELGEAFGGTWLAQNQGATKLTPDPMGTAWIDWEWGVDYRLALHVAPGRVSGTISDEDGRLLARLGYKLDRPATSCGRPTLVSGGFDARFSSAEYTTGEPCTHRRVPAPPYTARGGIPEVRADASGFFSVAPLHGVWWLIDPRGNGFLSIGTDHVHSDVHWCAALGYAPYARNIRERYDNDILRWSETTTDRLRRWGFTALGVNSVRTVRYRGLPHTLSVGIGEEFAAYVAISPQEHGTGFPDVFDPLWPEHCRFVARRYAEAHRDDPWLLGYFLDNELEWFGKNHRPTGLADTVWDLPAVAPARDALLVLLEERYPNVRALNTAWDTTFSSVAEAAAETAPPPDTPASVRDRQAFVREAARRYFEVACAAFRDADPNHLILGCRFAGDAPGIWDIAGRSCDVVSINIYPRADLARGIVEGLEQKLEEAHRESQRPLIVTEWSFPALDSGLPCTVGAGERFDTQQQRARAFEIMQTTLLRLPFVVGSHFFMWVDEPSGGISPTFEENSNYGLVDERDDPYPPLVDAATRLHANAAHIHRTGVHSPLRLGDKDTIALLPRSETPRVAPSDAEPRMSRSGAALSMDNGVLQLRRGTPSGHAFDTVALEDTVLGRFGTLLHQRLEQDAWVPPDRVDPESIVIDARPDGSTILEMTFVKERGGAAIAKIDLEGRVEPVVDTPRAYRARFRFTILPGRPWFDARCLWIENTDAAPWHLVALYHYALPALGGDPADDAPLQLPPAYYLPAAAWQDPGQGLFYGVALADPRDYHLAYWIDPEGGFHPDAAYQCDTMLQPGVRLFPGDPGLRVFGARESAGPAQWKAIAWEATRQRDPAPMRIHGAAWRDRLQGGWAGQMIGVTIGAPYEFKANGRMIEGDLKPFDAAKLPGALAQDDLYLELSFLDLLRRFGLEIRPDDAARAWSETNYRLWHGNKAARENLIKGIRPPMSGSPACTEHWQDIDFQIESDIFGLLHPGMPADARDVASRFGVVLASGDGLYGGLYVAGLYAGAYAETNRVSLVKNALAGIPPDSDYAQAIGDVLDAYEQDPVIWQRAWLLVEEHWGDKDVCPSGRGKPFNISATINGAYATIGLLYGGGDFWKTAEIATRCGHDADCNASTACGVLGTMLGFSGLPPEATAPFAELAGKPFENSALDFEETVAACEALVADAVARAGGHIDNGDLLIP